MKLIYLCCENQSKYLMFRVHKSFNVQNWINRNIKNLKLFNATYIETKNI